MKKIKYATQMLVMIKLLAFAMPVGTISDGEQETMSMPL